MEPTAHRRMPWTSVPASVRDAVAVVLGAPVVAAESQSGGFSPGSADRVVTASGRRAFVKTASTDLNAESVDIHRAEARVAALVPHAVDAPRLLGVVDHGGWIALVFEDVDGRLPHVPWRAGELEATLDAFAAVGRHRVPEDAGLPALDSRFAHEFAAWGRLGEEALVLVPGDLAAWAREWFDDLDALARSGVEALRGDRLVHLDARADNVLVRPDGSVVLVDWPWAARGAGWFDVLGLLFNVRLYNPGFDAEAVIARHPGFADMSTDAATAVLAGIAGHFLEVSRRAPVPSIPTLRRFQHDQAVVCLQWVRERLE